MSAIPNHKQIFTQNYSLNIKLPLKMFVRGSKIFSLYFEKYTFKIVTNWNELHVILKTKANLKIKYKSGEIPFQWLSRSWINPSLTLAWTSQGWTIKSAPRSLISRLRYGASPADCSPAFSTVIRSWKGLELN